MFKSEPTLDIIIVNWNSGDQLRKCIRSIAESEGSFSLERVVVVDNASSDNSLNKIRDYDVPLFIKLNSINSGFAVGCNQGAKYSNAQYLLFLNPDVRLFRDTLKKSLEFMNSMKNTSIGILGVQLVDDNGRIARTCSRFPTARSFISKIFGLDLVFPKLSLFMKEWCHTENREVDQVMGAFFLIRRSLFQSLGGFDERFFVYFEDLDLSYRAWKAGWRSFYLADAKAYHKGGGTSRQIKDRRLFYSLRSRILYSYKHFGWWSATAVTLMTLIVEPFTRLAWAAIRFSGTEMVNTLKGYIMLWRATPAILKEAWKRGRYESATSVTI